jgi:outer membrane protein assembly factor BamB
LNANDGRIRWASNVAGVNVTMPAVASGRVFVNAQDPGFGLFALDAKSGALVWSTQLPGESQATVSAANGVVYELSEDGRLMMFDAATGSLLAVKSDPAGRPFSARSGEQPAVVNGVVYAATGDPDASNGVDAFKLPHGSTLAAGAGGGESAAP